jgi:membrane-bound serine protease (ClpP class)
VYYDDTAKDVAANVANPVHKNAGTLQDFVAGLDGRTLRNVTITTLKGPPGHRTLTLDVHFNKLGLGGQIAHTLDTPWIAYSLFVVGLLLIVFEFFTAGIGIAGFVGACALVGGCFGFSHLPINFWAVGLLLLGILGLSIDVQAGGLGAWTFIGAAALTAGSIWLYGGSSQLDPKWWILVIVIGGSVVFMLSGMTAMVRARFSTPTIGRQELVGEMGCAEADVSPDGVVRVRDALWKARTNRATPIKAGDAVRVVSVEGIVLEVEPEAGGARDYRHRS